MKLILAEITRKDAAGLDLTAKEQELLCELYRRMHLKPRESIHVDASTGEVRVKKTVDAEPIMDAVHGYADVIVKRGMPQKYIGSIDPLTAQNWATEWGVRIGSKEFAQLAVKRLKNDLD